MKALSWKTCGLFMISCVAQGVPLMQKIDNKTGVGYIVLFHSDRSTCSLQNKNQIVDSRTIFKNIFLLDRNTQRYEPNLILRPFYYYDQNTNRKIQLLNQQFQFDREGINVAYNAWKQGRKKRKFINAQDWFEHWVGKDIVVISDVIEALGYLMHKSRIHIKNSIKEHAQWLNFSKGVFSHLVLEIDMIQHERKGIQPLLRVIPGEGGVCEHGVVDII